MFVNFVQDNALRATSSDAIVASLIAATSNHETSQRIAPCFTPGALIATMKGEVPVEQIKLGDKVLTRDNGLQQVRWIGARTLTAAQMCALDDARPVLIRKGALGNGCPQRDIIVSPHHRMLVTSDIAMMLFDEREVLVAARHLTGLAGIERIEAACVTYFHMLFDHHEVILADGAWTESFQPSDSSLNGLDPRQKAEILAIFPELAESAPARFAPARRALGAGEASLILG